MVEAPTECEKPNPIVTGDSVRGDLSGGSADLRVDFLDEISIDLLRMTIRRKNNFG
jgi:hypothetical protein